MHFKPYGLSFRGKSAIFPLTLGRAALCRRLAFLFLSTSGREFGMLALRVRASVRVSASGNGAVSLRAADAVCGVPGIQQQARGVS